MKSVIVTKKADGTIKKGYAVELDNADFDLVTVITSGSNINEGEIFGVAVDDAVKGELVGICVAGDCKVAVSGSAANLLHPGVQGDFKSDGSGKVASGSSVPQFMSLEDEPSGGPGNDGLPSGSDLGFQRVLLFDRR